MNKLLGRFDEFVTKELRRRSIPMLRVALGIVFVWFGALKIFGVSPVADLIQSTYWFFPANEFLLILGIWEVVIGVGLLFKIALRATIALLLLQMAGTFFAAILAPGIFVDVQNVMLLTMEGEFLVKNLVLVSAALVIGGHEVSPAQAEEPRA